MDTNLIDTLKSLSDEELKQCRITIREIREERNPELVNMELKELLKQLPPERLRKHIRICTELLEEERSQKEKAIYIHDCYGESNHHFNKYKHWAKVIKGIDDSKSNGYAFIGDFLNTRVENLVHVDDIIVEVCNWEYKLYKINSEDTDDVKELLLVGNTSALITFIQEVKKLI